ncbi:hypothetical protein B0H34DRAFT_800262 [Crassisporium funariophilum]|nr:hypothetical protein B0H34DRAFT_800262 [Crassisporium funariophilum]
MSSNLKDPYTEIYSLPQCGFGSEIDFDTLIQSNRFLFRVYTPKEKSPFSDDTDPFFVAPKFDELFARSPVDIPNVKFSEPLAGSYADVAKHMEWTTRSTSPYISTSFSFSWSIWEAVRRYHLGVKKDIEIAIIDATALGGRAATAVQLLRKCPSKHRDKQFLKWYRFSQDSQSVLVYGMVPRPAVLASIPLLHILRKMPSYFLHKDQQIISGNPLDQAAWDYSDRKSNFRSFCQDMSTLFFSRPVEVRLRDSTGGAVRLALSFLRPFIHRLVQDDFNLAISYLRTLAISISHWPSQIWIRDHPEVQHIIDSMVLAVAEELRERYRQEQQEEISRLHIVIDGLEHTIRTKNAVPSQYLIDEIEVDSDGEFELEFEESDEPTLVASESTQIVKRRPSLQMSVAVLPRIPISFQTPITPPESPRNSLFIPTVVVPHVDLVPTPITFNSLSPKGLGYFSRMENIPSFKSSPSSESPASPPPTPPPRLAVFSLPLAYEPEKVDPASDDEEIDAQQNEAGEGDLHAEEIVKEQPAANEEQSEEPEEEELEEEQQEPVQEAEQASPPPSPSSSWVPVSSATTLSSRRSSVASVETLCDTSDHLLKRFSIASSSHPDPFQHVHRISFARSVEMLSRTVSFSDPWPGIPDLPTPAILPSMIALPPSPASSIDSMPSSPSASPRAPRLPVLLDLPIIPSTSLIPPKRRISLLEPLPENYDDDDDTDRSTTVAETASYIVTGFLVGAFITLFLFSTQRRTLLYLT